MVLLPATVCMILEDLISLHMFVGWNLLNCNSYLLHLQCARWLHQNYPLSPLHCTQLYQYKLWVWTWHLMYILQCCCSWYMWRQHSWDPGWYSILSSCTIQVRMSQHHIWTKSMLQLDMVVLVDPSQYSPVELYNRKVKSCKQTIQYELYIPICS